MLAHLKMMANKKEEEEKDLHNLFFFFIRLHFRRLCHLGHLLKGFGATSQPLYIGQLQTPGEPSLQISKTTELLVKLLEFDSYIQYK